MNEKILEAASSAYRNGEFEEMLIYAKKIINLNNDDDYGHYLSAVAYKELGMLIDSEREAKRAIDINPQASNARLLLATVLRQIGKISESEMIFKSLISEFPEHEIVASNYSFLLNDCKRFDESIKMLHPFIAKNNIGEAIMINIGNAYRGLGDIQAARYYYTKALSANGKYVSEAKANLSVILIEEGRLNEAMIELINLHNSNQAPPESYLNLGIIAMKLDRADEATKWIEIGESKGLNSATAISIYALSQARAGNPMTAVNRIKKYLEKDDSIFMLLCVWLGIAQKFCLYDEIRMVRVKILKSISNNNISGVTESNLFDLLGCDGISPMQHLQLARSAASRLIKNQKILELNPRRKTRIRIGYLCADFRDHPVAHLMIGVFKNHDREQFEVYGYNIGQFDDTIYRYRSIAYLDHYIEAADMGFEQLAKRIASDEIDILVDLVGYTENCKPQTLFFKPAPIVVSYLGFVGTTGMDVVDYIIADEIVLPPNYESAFTEKPIYLPRCYQATDGTLVVETITRAELGLPDDKFVFVSLNNGYKLNDRFVALWAKILLECPASVIWLLASDEAICDNVIEEFGRLGIDKSRIFFFKRQSKARFLGALACADLFLDSSPYNAGTTASDALYAGCPVITLPGEIYASRMAVSIVSHAGLPELVCASEQEYIDKAVRIYADTAYRDAIRQRAAKAKDTRLFDTTDATRCLEAGFIAAYERYLNGLAPAAIHVADTGWVRDESHQRPFAGYRLTSDEVFLIEGKLKMIGGDEALNHFRQFVTPNSVTATIVETNETYGSAGAAIKPTIKLTTLKESDSTMSQPEQVLNFFNPVFWGVKDPETFADLMRLAAKQTEAYHFADNMFVFQRNNSMLHDQPFMASWEKNAVSTNDKAIIWRRYIKVMAGFHCSHLEGDFVECGAYQGTGAKTVVDYLGGPVFAKTFWLYDMFDHNEKMVNHAMPGHKPELYDEVCKRFEGYPNVKVVKGFLPDVLAEGSPEKIAYLHIDLNQAPAEIATLEALFDRVVPGGMIILDDYEMFFYRAQKYAEDDWFGKRGYKVFPLPTSQGFVIKR